MIQHNVGLGNPSTHFVQIESRFQVNLQSVMYLQLPAWRPGRYELGNFAKNIKGFSVRTNTGTLVPFKKVSKDQWEIHTSGLEEIVVSYAYYANQPDAGACYLTEDLLYLNPVHCFLYEVNKLDVPHEVNLLISEGWQIACQLPQHGNKLLAPNFDALADAPFFASPALQHHTFSVDDTKIHFWFYGAAYPLIAELEKDTKSYTSWQKKLFGELPCANYHFLYLLLPTAFRHGVEHLDSTVIAMGPTADLANESMYKDLLAISSHELFHLWNIKRIRPQEMLPYDFAKENYSTLGYVYEGITTYYGDLALWQCGVWDWDTYANSLSGDLTRHLLNDSRNHYSVAESSWDTWLDGYVPGVPGRKMSIYFDGLVAALIADVMILEATEGMASLNQVMKRLYEESWKKGRGYTQESYKALLEEVSGLSFTTYFQEVIEGRGKMEAHLKATLEKLGLELVFTEGNDLKPNYRIVKFSAPSQAQSKLFDFWTQRN